MALFWVTISDFARTDLNRCIGVLQEIKHLFLCNIWKFRIAYAPSRDPGGAETGACSRFLYLDKALKA